MGSTAAPVQRLRYTLGPAADLLLRRLLGDRAPAIGPVLFRYGFVFSIGLTLLPIPLVAIGWLFRLLGQATRTLPAVRPPVEIAGGEDACSVPGNATEARDVRLRAR